MSSNFTKVVRLGTIPHGKSTVSVFCEIKFTDGRLSISGVEGPRPSGNAVSCGQIGMHMDEQYRAKLKLAPGWTNARLSEFLRIWDKWHLNDMQAGTPAQMAELARHDFPGYPTSHYDWAKEMLCGAGLEPDNGYSYGSAWLRAEVPVEILDFLRALPASDKQPAWV